MRKFDTTRGDRKQALDKAVFQNRIWNVTEAVRKAPNGLIYYRLRRPHARTEGPVVRADRLDRLIFS